VVWRAGHRLIAVWRNLQKSILLETDGNPLQLRHGKIPA
jgi:hypothetical protein